MVLRLRRARPGGATTGTDVAASGATEAPAPLPLKRPVFDACGTTFTWADVHAAMVDDGSWHEVEGRTARGRMLVAADVAGPSGTALRDAARAFRHARGLVAGEDLQRWFGQWGISDEEWFDWLDRSLRMAAAPEPVSPLDAPRDSEGEEPEDPGAEGENGRASWAEAVCSGDLFRAAGRLADAVSAWGEGTGGSAVPGGEDRWQRLRQSLEDLDARPIERRDLDRLVTTRAAEWLQMDMELAEFADADAVHEAVACCRDDGATLEDVAARAGVSCGRQSVFACDLPPTVRSTAVSAPLGAAVAVGSSVDATAALVVFTRRPPSLDDSQVASMAEAACADERLQAAVDRWVHWYD